jgi:hypothetical protein
VLNRPSTRRKAHAPELTINLVPMLDALVTLITFLLFTMAIVSIVSISSPMPISSQKVQQDKMNERPLQLTARVSENAIEVFSPFDRIAARTFKKGADGKLDLVGFHTYLLDIKKKFPKDRDLVMIPVGSAPYDLLISVMDAARMLEAGDPPLFIRNEKTGVEEITRLLFSDIVFGNLLSRE